MTECKSSLITAQNWGSINGRVIEQYTLKNEAGQEVDIITYGATITNIRIPDKHGNVDDILLGFDNISGMHHLSFCFFHFFIFLKFSSDN